MNGLLDDSVEVNREALEEAVEKAALSCARGPVQAATIHEIIETGCVTVLLVPWTGYRPVYVRASHRQQIGRAGISFDSWQGLNRRLRAAGFDVRVAFDKSVTPPIKRYDVRWRLDNVAHD